MIGLAAVATIAIRSGMAAPPAITAVEALLNALILWLTAAKGIRTVTVV